MYFSDQIPQEIIKKELKKVPTEYKEWFIDM